MGRVVRYHKGRNKIERSESEEKSRRKGFSTDGMRRERQKQWDKDQKQWDKDMFKNE